MNYYLLIDILLILIAVIQCYILAYLLSTFTTLKLRTFNRYLIVGILIILALFWMESPSYRMIKHEGTYSDKLKLAIVDRYYSDLSEDYAANTYNAVDDKADITVSPENTHGDYVYQLVTSDKYVDHQVAKEIDLIQISKGDGFITKQAALNALNYIKDNQFDFVLIPLGVEANDPDVERLFNDIIESGTLVITSQSNFQSSTYPANYNGVISVSNRKGTAYTNSSRVNVLSNKTFTFREEEHRFNDLQAAYVTNILMNTYNPKNIEVYQEIIEQRDMRLNWLIRLIR